MNDARATTLQIDHPHALPADQVLAQLSSTRRGLTVAEVERRLKAVGRNRLPASVKDGLLKRFFKHFNDVLIYVLLVAAAITALLAHWVDTGGHPRRGGAQRHHRLPKRQRSSVESSGISISRRSCPSPAPPARRRSLPRRARRRPTRTNRPLEGRLLAVDLPEVCPLRRPDVLDSSSTA